MPAARAESCALEETRCPGPTSPRAADWPTLGADMLRSGYNAGERGQPPLEKGWAVSLISDPLNPVAVSGSLVFASGQDLRFRDTGPLMAAGPRER